MKKIQNAVGVFGHRIADFDTQSEGLAGYKIRAHLRNGATFESQPFSVEDTDFDSHGQLCDDVFSASTEGGQINLALNTGGKVWIRIGDIVAYELVEVWDI